MFESINVSVAPEINQLPIIEENDISLLKITSNKTEFQQPSLDQSFKDLDGSGKPRSKTKKVVAGKKAKKSGKGTGESTPGLERNSNQDELHNLVYQRKRYDPCRSINSVYIPSRELLFKMMKACISCDLKEDLWIVNY